MRICDKSGYYMYFRMSPERFDELLSKIGPLITRKNTTYRKSISPAEQLALTLRFLAHGGEQQICALNYRIGVSTTHNIVKRVCDAIWTVLSGEYLKIPDKKTFIDISKKFNVYCNFPQCLGAIDGKHVVIQQPKHSGTVYHNYKGTNSIILMAACDAEYRFTIVDIGAPGICSDGGVFSNSVFGKLIEQKKLDLPADEKLAGTDIKVPYCFVGDEAFPLLPNLLRPYPGKNLPLGRAVFNYRLSRARRIIENTFGILAARWRIFKNIINANPENVVKFVQATVCLHNYLRTCDIRCLSQEEAYCPSNYVDSEGFNGVINPGQWRKETETNEAMTDTTTCYFKNSGSDAKKVRELYQDFFMSEQGQLPWQTEVVTRGSTPELCK
ncbi:uncharacterized protein [Centruroides vittatus]|uniref:uncharacterized protein n=1 Tax=Centruroides vittatus TaxID=120091 RepID=UPI00350FD305